MTMMEEQTMTLGEKIREARKRCGLSQEQLAEKLCVSRSAIAKWETDKGLPDIGNLKTLSRLLNVSVDHLLDEGETADELVIRESYHLASYGRGCKKVKKDRVIREKFPDAQIYTLLGRLELTKGEKIVDNALGFLTPAPFGVPDMLNSVKNLDKEFYLVEKDGKQYIVTVTDEFVETRPLTERISGNSFQLGDWSFIKCNYEVK